MAEQNEIPNAEEATELELETPAEDESNDEPESESSSDPLDSIDDLVELRNRAKGYRSERNRYKTDLEKKDDPKEPEVQSQTEPKGDYLSRKDFYKANERKAINTVTKVQDGDSDEVKARKEYIAENWDHIKGLYQPRNGKDTPEDIIEDLNDATMLFLAKNPPKPEDNLEELSSTSGGGSPSGAPKKEATKEPPAFSMPKQPEDWYPDPEGKLKKE